MGYTPAFWRVLIFGCVGMALFGYDTGVVSGSLVMMSSDFELDTFRKEFAVSSTVLLAAVGSVAGAPLNDHFGRRPVVAAAALLYIIGSLIIASAGGYGGLISGRMLLGVAIGFASSTVPHYSAELSPPTERGMVVTLNDLNIVAGQLLAGIVNALVVDLDGGWRIAMGLAAVPAAVMLVGVFFLPESPRWLAMQGRMDEAEAVVRSVCSAGAQAEAEVAAIRADVQAQQGAPSFGTKLRRLWTERELRRAVLLGMSMMAMNQLSGINTVMYYSATVLVGVGFSPRVAIWLAAACCLAQLLGVCISVHSMDRYGRRKTALRSVVGVVVTLGFLSFCFYLTNPEYVGDGLSLNQHIEVERHAYPLELYAEELRGRPPQRRATKPSVGMCVDACKAAATGGGKFDMCKAACEVRLGSLAGAGAGAAAGADAAAAPAASAGAGSRSEPANSPLQMLAVATLMAYLVAFGSGLSGVPWVIGSEIYPTDVRSTAVGQNTLASWLSNWVFNFLVAQTFLDLVELLHSWGAFLVYAGFSLGGGVWMYYYLPETMNLSLEEVATLFRDPYPAPLRAQQARAKVAAPKKEIDKLLPK